MGRPWPAHRVSGSSSRSDHPSRLTPGERFPVDQMVHKEALWALVESELQACACRAPHGLWPGRAQLSCVSHMGNPHRIALGKCSQNFFLKEVSKAFEVPTLFPTGAQSSASQWVALPLQAWKSPGVATATDQPHWDRTQTLGL